jgi:hypothetical protein
MDKEKFGRREFMTHLMQVLAVATGLSAVEVERLLGAVSGEGAANLDAALQKSFDIYQKSAKAEIKALKVLIEDNRRVFENEFGRITPIKTQEIRDSIMKVCGVHWAKPGEMVDVCRAVYAKGSECGKLKTCGDNSCSGLKCPVLESCETETCPGLNCPNLGSCGTLSMINGSFFEKFKSDPYVQHLFERFNVTTSDALAVQVRDILR